MSASIHIGAGQRTMLHAATVIAMLHDHAVAPHLPAGRMLARFLIQQADDYERSAA